MLLFPSPTVGLMVSALLLETFLPPVAAFVTAATSSGSDSRLTEILHQQWKRRRSLSLAMIMDNNNNNNNGNDPVSELTSALARLDQQWQIQQKSQQQQQQQWSKLELEDDDDQRDATRKKDFVYVLQPSSSSSSDTTVTTTNTTPPRCMIVFIGGMGLGQFPQVVYNELLLRLCQELNAVVVAVPYSIITSDNNSNNNDNNMNAATPPPPPSMGQALDHFELSKQTGERARKAILQLQKQLQKQQQQQQDSNNNSQNSINKAPPVYLLTHSLGGKLAVIYMAAMRKSNFDIAGMGLMSFNNFRLGQSFQLIKEFASQFSTTRRTTSTSTILDQLFGMAETALSVMGVEFTPTPEQMNRLIAMKYNSNDMPPTRLFTFAQDQLDNTRDFYENACSSNDQTTDIDVSLLPGTHLTPVLFKLGLEQIIQDETARQVVRDNIGFQQASFFGGNDEEELQWLVREIVSWIQHGQVPTKRPDWMDSSTSSTIKQPPPTSLLTGSTNTSD